MVGGLVLAALRGDAQGSIPAGGCALVDAPALDVIDPEGEGAINGAIQGYRERGEGLGGFKAEFIVPEETRGGQGKGAVAEGEADIG